MIRVAGWLLWPLRWLARQWWRVVRDGGWFRRVAVVLGTVVVSAVVILAVTVPWPGYLFAPPFRAVEYAPINDRQWLSPEPTGPFDAAGQGEPDTWQGWTREDRMLFYYHPQGSAQVMLAQMRYAWFVNLERAGSRDRFAAPENMGRYGFLTDLRQQPDPQFNPGNLPVGMTKYFDVKVGAELLDFTCALCHTGELHYRGTALRVDGGQAMHAITSMKPGQFQAELMLSMLATASRRPSSRRGSPPARTRASTSTPPSGRCATSSRRRSTPCWPTPGPTSSTAAIRCSRATAAPTRPSASPTPCSGGTSRPTTTVRPLRR
jgi:hypothetical protein